MHQAILSLLSVDAHINVADYLRDLIRRDLTEKGVVFELEKKEFLISKAKAAPQNNMG